MKVDIANLKRDEQVILELKKLYNVYGYKKYNASRFEEYSLYLENKNFFSSDKIITFNDLDGKLLALKPDVTLSMAKNTTATYTDTQKLYYLENVYRESKESHVYKEIMQMGIEVLGNVDLYTIIEIICLAEKSLDIISSEFIISISHMDFILGFLNSLNLEHKNFVKLLYCIRRKNSIEIKKIGIDIDLSEKQVEILIEMASIYGDFSENLEKAKALVINEDMKKAVLELEKLYKTLKAIGLGKNIQLDFSMINDTDYYDGVIFKGYINGLPRSVLAGGKYSSMMRKMNKDADGIGFAIYLNELQYIFNEQSDYDVDVVILYDEKSDYIKLFEYTNEFINKNQKVFATTNIPKELTYKKKFFLEGKKLLEIK